MTLTASSSDRTTRIQKAKDAGYNNEQILDAFMQQGYGDRIQNARSSNFSDDDILNAFAGSDDQQAQGVQVQPQEQSQTNVPDDLTNSITNRDVFIRNREVALERAKTEGKIDDPTYTKFKRYLSIEDRTQNLYPNWAISKDLRKDTLKKDIASGLISEEQGKQITEYIDNEPSVAWDTIKGQLSGLTFGLSEKVTGEAELPLGKMGELQGQLLNFTAAEKLIGKGIQKLGIDKAPVAVKALARATGIGLYGATGETIEHIAKEGEMPSAQEVAKWGGTWFALDAGLQVLGAAGRRFMQTIGKLAEKRSWSKRETLTHLMEKASEKGIDLPEAPLDKRKVKTIDDFIEFSEKEAEVALDVDTVANQRIPRVPAGSVEQDILEKISFETPRKTKDRNFDFVTEMVDEFHPIRKRIEAYEQVTGQKISADENPYNLMRLTKGLSGVSESFLKYGTRDFKTGKEIGPSLKKVLSPIRDKRELFSGYLTSKRALEYLEMGKNPANITKQQAEEFIAKYKDEFEPVYEQYRKYRDDVTKYLQDSGMLSEKQVKGWKELQKDHVSFYRVFEDFEAGGPAKSKGLEPVQPIRKMKEGGKQTIIDPLESDVNNTYAMVEAAKKNEAVKALATFLEKEAPQATKKVTSTAAPTEGNVEKTLNETPWADLIKGDKEKVKQLSELSTRFEKNAFNPTKDTIAYWENGKRQLVKVPPDVANVVKGMDVAEVPNWLRMASIPSRILRGTVVLDPIFQTRLFLKDQVEGAVYSKYGFIPVIDSLNGMGSWLVGGKNYKDWLASGGALATRRAIDRFGSRSTLNQLTEKNLQKFGRVIKNPLEITGMFSEMLEESTRIGEFAKGAKKAAPGKEGLVERALQSRDITLDFARMGSKTRGLNMLSQFFNAKVQGWDKIMRDLLPAKVSDGKIRMKPENFGASMKAIGAMTLPALYFWYANRGDPRYEELPAWVKDNNIVILPEDDTEEPYLIPLPFEIGQFFYRLPQTVMENLYGDRYKRRIDQFFMDQAKDLAPAIPAFATPLVQSFSNRDPFTGRQIVPERLKNVERIQQETEFTSPTVKSLAKAIGSIPGIPGITDENPFAKTSLASPMMLEAYIKSLTGGAGRKTIQGVDAILRKLGAVEDKRPELKPADDPLFGSFRARYPTSYSRSVEEFYSIFNEQETLHRSMKEAQEKRKVKDLTRLKKSYKVDMKPLRRMRKAFSENFKRARTIQSIPADKITPEERAKLLDNIYINMTRMARLWVERYLKKEKEFHANRK